MTINVFKINMILSADQNNIVGFYKIILFCVVL